MDQESNGNRKACRCMIGWERGIAATFDQKSCNPSVIGPDALIEKQNDLIDSKPDKEGQAGSDQEVARFLSAQSCSTIGQRQPEGGSPPTS
ncbi:hypothetical protein FHT28_007172 [Rhizobium sp. SG570]|jgi:hypothetical protein|nr:hypothetical protein [Rhizobium sp. SG570]